MDAETVEKLVSIIAAQQDIQVKSQQRGEPDITENERREILKSVCFCFKLPLLACLPAECLLHVFVLLPLQTLEKSPAVFLGMQLGVIWVPWLVAGRAGMDPCGPTRLVAVS
jgi:hypothetical protein